MPHALFRRTAALSAAVAMSGFALFAGAAAADAPPAPTAPTVSPNPVVAGGTLTVSGTGCSPTGPANAADVAILDDEDEVLAEAFASDFDPDDDGALQSDGSWSLSFMVPADIAAGTYVLASLCDQYDDGFFYPDVALTITGSATGTSSSGSASSSSVSPGDSLTVTGSGFDSGEKVTVTLHSTPVQLTVLTASSAGTASGAVTIPSNTAAGSHTIEMVGQTSGHTVSIAIQVAGTLAATGSPTLLITEVGGMLLMVGVVVLVAARLRRVALMPAGAHAAR